MSCSIDLHLSFETAPPCALETYLSPLPSAWVMDMPYHAGIFVSATAPDSGSHDSCDANIYLLTHIYCLLILF